MGTRCPHDCRQDVGDTILPQINNLYRDNVDYEASMEN